MKIILLLLPLFLIGEEFITNEEYGKMLYENPRGIGCVKCHKKSGEGGVIATYLDDSGKEHNLTAPDIRKIDFAYFFQRVVLSKKFINGKFKAINYSVMPKYNYLTKEEVLSIYNYLQELSRRRKENE